MPTPKRKPVAPLQDLVLRVSLREIAPEIWRGHPLGYHAIVGNGK